MRSFEQDFSLVEVFCPLGMKENPAGNGGGISGGMFNLDGPPESVFCHAEAAAQDDGGTFLVRADREDARGGGVGGDGSPRLRRFFFHWKRGRMKGSAGKHAGH